MKGAAAMLLVTVAAAAGLQGQTASIGRLSWLQGCWESATPQRTIEEQWMAPKGGTMLGMSRTVRGDRLTEYELVVIREQDGRLAYEAHPSGQKSAVFLSETVSDSTVVFANPQHDFPQRVGYERKGDSLSAWIEGVNGGQSRRVDFPYRRAACPGR